MILEFEGSGKSLVKATAIACLASTLFLAGCGGGSDTSDDMTTTPEPDPAIAERAAIDAAIDAAGTAVGMVDNDATDATVAAADAAITAARNAIAAAANVPAEEKAANTRTVDAYADALAASKTARQMALDDAADAERMAMMATAMKLRAGINVPSATAAAVYATDDISVTIGTDAAVPLSEDEDAVVAALHGWEGMRFAAEPDGDAGTYEAVVYSNVGEPTEGAKFNATYTLDGTSGETGDVTSLTDHASSRVASPSFDQNAGVKTFELPTNTVRVIVAGSYRGVAGTYYCTPAAGNECAAQKAESGFNLGGAATADNAFTAAGGAWTFKPTDPEARLMDVPDNIYASYGWWLHKSEDGETFTASAFAAPKGAVTPAAGIDSLHGTATYSGGAAGKYALHSATGGTNDAGHFTADATLEADFSDNVISGTIDNFTGADGQSRAWSVELMTSAVSGTGGITGSAAQVTAGDPLTNQMTKWTIDGTAAAAAGEWSGTLYDNGDDGVPQVATGTFYSEYGADGKMVGGFGANN